MTKNPMTPLGTSVAAALDDERFAVSRVKTARFESDHASITFEVEVHRHRCGQKIFCGLLDRDLKAGVGLSIDTRTGEVVDLINDQGIIGFLNTAPLPEGRPVVLRLSMDKFGPTHICTAEIGDENILYPAVLLDRVTEIGAVLGATLADDHAITFENARLSVDCAAPAGD